MKERSVFGNTNLYSGLTANKRFLHIYVSRDVRFFIFLHDRVYHKSDHVVLVSRYVEAVRHRNCILIAIPRDS